MLFLFALSPSSAHAETRSLKLYFVHTKERAEIVYKRNGRYDQGGLTKINRFLRDWRRNEPTKMDPRLLDLVWDTYRAVGARDYIHVVSAYRSPATNSMLRKRSKGVANKSQHMLGKAMDFYIPGVPLSKLRAAALRMQSGGVGYYPRSGSPFVHLDVGSVRHWPRMSRKELVAVFPNGKTLHVPSDGKPLPGYEQAVASYESRKRTGASVQVASAPARKGGFLAALFGGGADEEEETSPEFEVAAKPAPARTREAPRGDVLPGVGGTVAVAAAPEVRAEPTPIIAGLPDRNAPRPLFAPRPSADVGVAAAAPEPVVAEEAETVALNIPLPTRRPDYAPPPALVEPEEAPIALAAATPAPRPGAIETLIAEGDADMAVSAFAPVPEIRPESGPMAEMVAAMPKPRPEVLEGQPLRLASAAASPKTAILANGGRAEEIIASGVKTTGKSAKPKAADLRPDPKPLVVPIPKVAAQWAMEVGSRATRSIASSRTPSTAHNAIRTAPTLVYTDGFVQTPDTPDMHRFAGKAVTFLSVAKFEGQ